MADLQSFLGPYGIFPIAQENKYLGIFCEIILFNDEIVCCVYPLDLPHQGDSNKYTQHTIFV